MRTIRIITSLLLIAACSEDPATPDATAFAPTAGTWSWSETQFDTDDCNFGETFPAAVIDVTLWDLVLTDDGFTLDNEIWTADPIACVVTDMDLACDISIVRAEEAWPEESSNEGVPDATYTYTGTVTGTFTDADSGTIAMTADVTCEGADCDAFGAEGGVVAPCSSELSGGFVRSE